MHPRTPAVAEIVRRLSNIEDQLGVLHDAYAGERCVVVSCGPSLSVVPTNRLVAALDGQLTIAVKQAIDVVGEQADFLCFNSFNVQRFRSPSRSTIRSLVRDANRRAPQMNDADLVFEQDQSAGDLQRSLAANCDFDAHPLGEGGPRPWGPGIMYELVLPLAVHLGVSEIVTLGWDIGDDTGRNTHFYDGDAGDASFDGDRGEAPALAGARGHLPGWLRVGARSARAFLAHHTGRVYNRAVPVQGETELVSKSTASVRAWLAMRGVTLAVVTPSTYFHPSIRRLSVDGFLELRRREVG